MIGTPEQREAIAAGLERTRGAAWAFGSEAWREMEIDNAVRAAESADAMRSRQRFTPRPLSPATHPESGGASPMPAWRGGDPREGLRAAKAELAEATRARAEASEHAERALRRVAKAEEDIAAFDGLDDK